MLYILTSCTRLMTKTLSIDDQTYRRLTSILNDMMHTKKHDVDYSDVIDVLIDVYQDSLTFSGENAGG
jgi:predicted CopG family antitoxin